MPRSFRSVSSAGGGCLQAGMLPLIFVLHLSCVHSLGGAQLSPRFTWAHRWGIGTTASRSRLHTPQAKFLRPSASRPPAGRGSRGGGSVGRRLASAGWPMRQQISDEEARATRRPLGREQLGLSGYQWLQREMRWLAQDYLLMVEEESLGYISLAEERALLAGLVDRFKVSKLQAHLERRLVEAPPRRDAVGAATIASRHTPTVWSVFQLCVQQRLQSRETNSKANWRADNVWRDSEADWRDDLEWTLLKQLRQGSVLELKSGAKQRASSAQRLRQPPPPRQTGSAAVATPPPPSAGRKADSVAASDVELVAEPKAAAKAVRSQPPRTRRPAKVREASPAPSSAKQFGAAGAVAGAAVEAAAGASVERQQPQPNKKQPLGRKQVGAATLKWLLEVTEVSAAEFMELTGSLLPSHTAPVSDADFAAILSAVMPHFTMTQLVSTVDKRLEITADTPAEVEQHAELVRTHVPTIWSSFSAGVRSRLQERAESSDGKAKWSESIEWRLLRELYAHAKDNPNFRWRLKPEQLPPPQPQPPSPTGHSPTVKARFSQAGHNPTSNPQVDSQNKAGSQDDGGSSAIRFDDLRASETQPASPASEAVAVEARVATDAGGKPSLEQPRTVAQAVVAAVRENKKHENGPGGKEEARLLPRPVWNGPVTSVQPLRSPARIEGATELQAAVRTFVERSARLLQLERQAAIDAAAATLSRVAAAKVANGEAAPVEDARLGMADSFLVEAASASDAGSADAADAAAIAGAPRLDLSGRAVSELKLRNVQALDDRMLLTLTPRNVSRLQSCMLGVGDVVLLSRDAEADSSAVAEIQGEAGGDEVLLRGVVSRISKFSLGVTLEYGSNNGAPASESRSGPEHVIPKRHCGVDIDAADGPVDGAVLLSALKPATAAEAPELIRSARALLGEPVRIEWLANDETHKRNLWALESLSAAAEKASAGRAVPALRMLRAIFGPRPCCGDGDVVGDVGDDVGDDVGAAAAGHTVATASFDSRLNAAQLEAVELAMSPKRPLSVIHGPPGTGKTAVLVELVQRSVARGERLLLCAPSNMAVDLLVLRLRQANPSLKLVRLGNPERIDVRALELTPEMVAARRESELKNETAAELERLLRKLSADPQMGRQRKAEMRSYLRRRMRRVLAKRVARGEYEALAAADVVLCTTTAAADTALLELPLFDVACVDEASQATQPNSWLPLLRAHRGVLLGDPQQLPATIISQQADVDGLGVSLIEEAMTLNPTDSRMLTTQWRMHESICRWASRQMYESKLQPHPSVATQLLAQLPSVEAKELTSAAIVAIDVPAPSGSGWELRDARGGISNVAEAEAVVNHVRSLLEAGLRPADVVVISPYSAQVSLISAQLMHAAETAHRGLGDVDVATIDAYQGREAQAVVVSLVRSNAAGAIGFLADKRRLNVAVTRARRHLAVACDSRTLRRDPFLRSLLDHCAESGVWTVRESLPKWQAASGSVVRTDSTSSPDSSPNRE